MYQDTIYIITNKTTGETKEVIFSSSDTVAVGLNQGEAKQGFKDNEGKEYFFINPNTHDRELTSINNLSNPDWTISKK